MQIGMIGLGKMGKNMATRLLQGGHEVVVMGRHADVLQEMAALGAVGVMTNADLVSKLDKPRAVWVMVPAGGPTESVLTELAELLEPGDVVIDGGNSNYKDTMRHAEMFAAKDMLMADVGTSGGVWGITEGYGMMVGGSDAAVARIRPALETLAPAPGKGWGHVGKSGAGHYTKMVHNGIEYGIMQAYAEGFEILKAKAEFDLDVAQIAEMWRYGTVIRSWLLDLTAAALAEDAELSEIAGYVSDSGEGRWTVFDSIDLDVPAPVITLALQMRFVSRQEESFAAKLLAAMRNQFGGHAVKKAE